MPKRRSDSPICFAFFFRFFFSRAVGVCELLFCCVLAEDDLLPVLQRLTHVLGPAQTMHELGVRRARFQRAAFCERGGAVRGEVQRQQRGGDQAGGQEGALGLEVAADE
jgi:hypothetical protein